MIAISPDEVLDLFAVVLGDGDALGRVEVPSHLSNASFQTTNPMRSQRSSSSGRGRIVAGADGVDAHVFHDLELALHARTKNAAPRGPGRGAGSRPGAERRRPLSWKPSFGRELKGADAKGCRDAVHQLDRPAETLLTALYSDGRLDVPAQNAGHQELLVGFDPPIGRDVDLPPDFADGPPRGR